MGSDYAGSLDFWVVNARSMIQHGPQSSLRAPCTAAQLGFHLLLGRCVQFCAVAGGLSSVCCTPVVFKKAGLPGTADRSNGFRLVLQAFADSWACLAGAGCHICLAAATLAAQAQQTSKNKPGTQTARCRIAAW